MKKDWFDDPNGEWYVPCTPAGTLCFWIAARTEDKAWANLLREAAHMPYAGKPGFIKRGYTINHWNPKKANQ